MPPTGPIRPVRPPVPARPVSSPGTSSSLSPGGPSAGALPGSKAGTGRYNADEYIAIFRAATAANRADAYRRGNIVVFPETGRLLATGDLHGHDRNLDRILRFAQLGASPAHHVILHEIIHGGGADEKGGDSSVETLKTACQAKIAFPDQVHFLLGNHDLAQMTGQEVSRSGSPRCVEGFNKAMTAAFAGRAGEVTAAMYELFLSQPIGARAGQIFFSHSTPPKKVLLDFDWTIFERPLTPADFEKTGSVYQLVWGRVYDQATVDSLARRLDVELFVIGHESQPEGHGTPTSRHVVLASDHGHGTCLPIVLGRRYTQAELVKAIKKLAAIA